MITFLLFYLTKHMIFNRIDYFLYTTLRLFHIFESKYDLFLIKLVYIFGILDPELIWSDECIGLTMVIFVSIITFWSRKY